MWFNMFAHVLKVCVEMTPLSTLHRLQWTGDLNKPTMAWNLVRKKFLPFSVPEISEFLLQTHNWAYPDLTWAGGWYRGRIGWTVKENVLTKRERFKISAKEGRIKVSQKSEKTCIFLHEYTGERGAGKESKINYYQTINNIYLWV